MRDADSLSHRLDVGRVPPSLSSVRSDDLVYARHAKAIHHFTRCAAAARLSCIDGTAKNARGERGNSECLI